mmetsp:Transcript_27877/g.65525  ORF Transcript_27877/g.65525 Transcript_27877/m.65525 type:complete len:109 (-) Transcript_27877:1590-1916(-)
MRGMDPACMNKKQNFRSRGRLSSNPRSDGSERFVVVRIPETLVRRDDDSRTAPDRAAAFESFNRRREPRNPHHDLPIRERPRERAEGGNAAVGLFSSRAKHPLDFLMG